MRLRSKILAAKLPFVDLKVAEWDATVRLQSLSGRDRLELLDWVVVSEQETKAYEADQRLAPEDRANLDPVKPLDQVIMQLIYALRDPKTGDRLFGRDDHDAILESVGYSTIERLYLSFAKLNLAQGVEDIETLKKSSD